MSDTKVKDSQTSTTRRNHFVKNNNRKTSVTSATPSGTGEPAGADVDKELYGFHPLRSLRNIFFGYRPKDRPLSAMPAYKAKSTENLSAIVSDVKNEQGKGAGDVIGNMAVTSTDPKPSIAARKDMLSAMLKNNKDFQAHDKRRSVPYNPQLSISADDLLQTGDWPQRTDKQRIVTPTAKTNVNLNDESCSNQVSDIGRLRSHEPQHKSTTADNEMDVTVTSLDDDVVHEDFFDEKWSSPAAAGQRQRQRALSEGCVFDDAISSDLDVVDGGHNLDVSIVKNKLAVKQKGKRSTTQFQHKITAAAEQAMHRESDNAVYGESAQKERHSVDSQRSSTTEQHNKLADDTELGQDYVSVPTLEPRSDVVTIAAPVCQPDHVTISSRHQGASQNGSASKSTDPDGRRHLVVNNEQLADVLLKRASRSPNQLHLEPMATTTGKLPNPPKVAPKSPMVSRNPEKKEEERIQHGGKSEASTKRQSNPKLTSRPEDGDKKETSNVAREYMKNDPKPMLLVESDTALQPMNQTNSSGGVQSGSISVDTSVITDATKRLKPRPKTMAPLGGTSTSEPAWMAELAAKKKKPT